MCLAEIQANPELDPRLGIFALLREILFFQNPNLFPANKAVHFVQQLRQTLDLIDDDDFVFGGKFLCDARRILAEGKINRVIQQVVGTGVAQRMLDEKPLAGLPWTEKKMRFLLQERGQVRQALDHRTVFGWGVISHHCRQIP